jgi:hypothetical protein
MESINAERRFVAATGLVSRRIGGDTILVPFTSGVGDLDAIYTLSEVGSRVWSMIQAPCSLTTIGTTLASEYDVSEDEAIRDALAFIDELASKRLVLEVGGL